MNPELNAVNLVSDLAGAVDRGELLAFYQPQIDVLTHRIVAVEALARWDHPEFGIIAPTVFIPLAEANELIADIGFFMIDEGCRCAALWNGLGYEVDVAVNVSAAQLTTPDFLDHLGANLERLSLAPERLIIEITESLPVIDVPEVGARLRELRALGLGVSVDDFGTGYSSLAQLMGLPASELKIDQSLIHDADASGRLMLAVVEMAHDQGIRVVAEGVETREHFDLVRALHCDRAQGYLLGRPGPEAGVEALLIEQPLLKNCPVG